MTAGGVIALMLSIIWTIRETAEASREFGKQSESSRAAGYRLTHSTAWKFYNSYFPLLGDRWNLADYRGFQWWRFKLVSDHGRPWFLGFARGIPPIYARILPLWYRRDQLDSIPCPRCKGDGDVRSHWKIRDFCMECGGSGNIATGLSGWSRRPENRDRHRLQHLAWIRYHAHIERLRIVKTPITWDDQLNIPQTMGAHSRIIDMYEKELGVL